jgi:hypothetical protein
LHLGEQGGGEEVARLKVQVAAANLAIRIQQHLPQNSEKWSGPEDKVW